MNFRRMKTLMFLSVGEKSRQMADTMEEYPCF